jgi:FkbM family methyltransferase
MALKHLYALSLVCGTFAIKVHNSTAATQLRGTSSVNGTSTVRAPPCQCEPNNVAWHPTTRTVPKCVFIDLGAADGNSFQAFLSNKYGPVANCPSGGQWEAFLVEANPQFTPQLESVAAGHPGLVHSMAATAAYTCQGSTSFSIDPDTAHNHWGSSMMRDMQGGMVTVPTVNVVKLIAENVRPDDWVMLKVDIEGAEFDLIPCLAQFSNVKLVDAMFLEEHTWLPWSSAYTKEAYAAAKTSMLNAGVSMPNYFSQTF